MSDRFALTGARIFDGDDWHEGAALVVRDGLVEAMLPQGALPGDIRAVDTGGGMLVPGFVDIQVNGGGGVMLNDHPDVASIETICRAHAPFGTTALLPTLITDTPAITAAAIAAGEAAALQKVPGFLGLHLEGPHLSIARKGAHDPALIRPMTDADQAMLIAARQKLPVLLTTIAPESVDPARVKALAKAGIIVSLGHSDTGHATAKAFAEAGASVVTHLFNAMSQIGNREPGLAGAAIDIGALSAGLIADGIHVHPATIRIALDAKQGPGRIVLVTDAMATIGTEMSSFTLNGRTIYRRDGSLRLADGTLAGADLDMISAIRFMHRTVGLELSEVLRMASLYPAQAIGQSHRLGRFANGTAADIVALSDNLDIGSVWIGGDKVFEAAAPR
ncbi:MULTISPECIES: N-acetylglucosamine-6-phosphate deacetylase [Mesorhizobium]|uniref:N-acetylglucosamine-6-phosphate deacetylase n=1 Tax=Mesorhizobium australicum (strain HAMBI 3006 / LMG 24608 / WSM2073) TaxID=754035 RepID=L0KF87_MESAW|nr:MULTISPECIES: N-acetylglucosamine-6-phosphate deacetylase [Mesorhizobium]MBZ9929953.1 N-acetylglucosamine-6-phosphate deacetylase [Mesorhizobium sp. BR1-1-5]AGB43185.1 N-acetylglucosamine-6-phosphate deacetylase [Mesorhizobium australicum WSM2073]MBZ9697137.1 N-acetylglucosamine-6-phosphate deacetylase [Mesorhizobium sp. CO1-1-9]MBZ9909780.1 N-acetylglucosamine-6-phosphate deacetylase [Mesorhizobium sp. BR115XR7A]TPK13428.1 N-acetylglucosamine-6-phosphate deacetylase [Mesorhizobium sp. B2-5